MPKLSCGHDHTEAEILSAYGSIMAARRITDAGGRPKKQTTCPKCGATCDGAREARAHCKRKAK